MNLNSQMKSIVRDKSFPIYVGIDVHKTSWSVCVVHQGEVLGRATLPTDLEGLQRYLKRYEGFEIHSVYEAGFSGFWLHRKLESWGVKNRIVAPNKLPLESGNRVKTDKRDSFKLAHYLSKGLLKGIHIPSEEQVAARQFLRTRNQLKQKRVSSLQHIKSLLHQYGVKVAASSLSQKEWKRIEALDLPEPVHLSLRHYWRVMRELDIQMKDLVEEAQKLLSKKEEWRRSFEILKSVPGIGSLTALAFVLEVGDWRRFSNEKKIGAYFGLTPAEYSSGESEHRGRITGQGNAWLRSLLIEASWILIEKDSEMKSVFLRLAHQTASRKKAIVAVARHLLLRIRRMMLDLKPYEFKIAV